MKHIGKIAFCTLGILFFAGCKSQLPLPIQEPEWCDASGFCSGDLIFVKDIDTVAMGAAISAATGEYTHVAIVECPATKQIYEDESVVPPKPQNIFVIEALPGKGVVRRPLEEFFDDIYYQMPDTTLSMLSYVTFMSLNINIDIPQVMEHLHQFVGLPYDDEFQPGNNKYYCSELVYETYLDGEGQHIFDLIPMNFKDSDGEVIPFWQVYFDSLSVLVPQNVPGTNPTQLSKSKYLYQYKIE